MSIEKFNHPALNALYKILDDIEAAEALLHETKQHLTQAITDLPSIIGDNEDLREAIAAHLYWFDERVSATAIKQAFNVVSPSHASSKPGKMKVLRYPSIDLTCIQCQQPFQHEVTSRSALKDGFRPSTCRECEAKRSENIWHTFHEQEEGHRQRWDELRSMPYYEYLQTPEWQERRKRAMKKAGFRCQVCNAYGVRLNTHHRTYERRGNEFDQDLIVLCADCHQIFHDNGSLAEE